MAIVEVDGLMTYKDENGDSTIVYPITKKDNVDGFEVYDNHIADDDIHVTNNEKAIWHAKQDEISDLSDIRSGANAGTTALQPSALTPYRPASEQNSIDQAMSNDIQMLKTEIQPISRGGTGKNTAAQALAALGGQPALVSGQNIKTVGGNSLLGSGDIPVGSGSALDAYPIGSIYMSVNSTNPGSIFGGTWQAWGRGKVPVCVDPNDSAFNTVQKTGGSKYLQEHTHYYIEPTVDEGGYKGIITGGSHRHGAGEGKVFVRTNEGATIARYTYGGSARANNINSDEPFTTLANTAAETHSHDLPNHQHNVWGGGVYGVEDVSTGYGDNLQPYITCYMWLRTA